MPGSKLWSPVTNHLQHPCTEPRSCYTPKAPVEIRSHLQTPDTNLAPSPRQTHTSTELLHGQCHTSPMVGAGLLQPHHPWEGQEQAWSPCAARTLLACKTPLQPWQRSQGEQPHGEQHHVDDRRGLWATGSFPAMAMPSSCRRWSILQNHLILPSDYRKRWGCSSRAGRCHEDVPTLRDPCDLRPDGTDVHCGTQLPTAF